MSHFVQLVDIVEIYENLKLNRTPLLNPLDELIAL